MPATRSGNSRSRPCANASSPSELQEVARDMAAVIDVDAMRRLEFRSTGDELASPGRGSATALGTPVNAEAEHEHFDTDEEGSFGRSPSDRLSLNEHVDTDDDFEPRADRDDLFEPRGSIEYDHVDTDEEFSWPPLYSSHHCSSVSSSRDTSQGSNSHGWGNAGPGLLAHTWPAITPAQESQTVDPTAAAMLVLPTAMSSCAFYNSARTATAAVPCTCDAYQYTHVPLPVSLFTCWPVAGLPAAPLDSNRGLPVAPLDSNSTASVAPGEQSSPPSSSSHDRGTEGPRINSDEIHSSQSSRAELLQTRTERVRRLFDSRARPGLQTDSRDPLNSRVSNHANVYRHRELDMDRYDAPRRNIDSLNLEVQSIQASYPLNRRGEVMGRSVAPRSSFFEDRAMFVELDGFSSDDDHSFDMVSYSDSDSECDADLSDRCSDVSSNCPEVDCGDNKVFCPICLDDCMADEKIRTIRACGHQFHSSCLRTWLVRRRKCPLCRRGIAEEP